MRYRKLGRSGLLVSELCLGTNMYGGGAHPFWKNFGGLEQSAVNAVIARAIDGGVNFIDTADGYSMGESETLIGQALKDLKVDRASIVISTKGGMQMTPGPNGGGASRTHLTRACENSLRRLGTDYLDVYLLHTYDSLVPFDETLRAFDDLVHAGKVRYVGCCNFAAWEAMKALGISEREGLARFEVVQCNWSIATRDIERELVPLARSEGIGIMAWGALLSGTLSGKYRRDGSSDQPGRFGGKIRPPLDHNKVHDIVDVLRAIGAAHGVTAAEIALAFLLHEPAATSILFGATRPEQVAANLRASGLTLTAEQFKQLDGVSSLPVDFATNLLGAGRSARELQYT
jgi:aryl-alcohol dehydrogenase-like predicted oxidoreductase